MPKGIFLCNVRCSRAHNNDSTQCRDERLSREHLLAVALRASTGETSGKAGMMPDMSPLTCLSKNNKMGS